MTNEAQELFNDQNKKLTLSIKLNYKPYGFLIDVVLRLIGLISYFFCEYHIAWLLGFNLLLLTLGAVLIKWNDSKITDYYKQFVNEEYLKNKLLVDFTTPLKATSYLIYSFLGFIIIYYLIYSVSFELKWFEYFFIALCSLIGTLMFCALPIEFDIRTKKRRIVDYDVVYIETIKEKGKKDDVKYVYVTKYFPDIIIDFKNQNDIENVQLDSVDYNDTQIAKLESELKNINNKIDAYLLESVLLGGLAFSGFLTVLSSNILNKENYIFDVFCNNAKAFFNQYNFANCLSHPSIIHNYFHRNDLFILIMLLCLLSSVFFLLVLTLRIRYMSLSLEMDHLMRVMVTFNAKEEELYNIKKSVVNFEQQNRLDKITKK
ncbi:MAG: hypothetical protein M0D57_00315 [Sphingobacteriales bacterium JAD_PAG50586_3]|nr:MAG: hypothetical protein M0D57_00315 [Sphingobacteriales bacterium JAD_PAG50586_3]